MARKTRMGEALSCSNTLLVGECTGMEKIPRSFSTSRHAVTGYINKEGESTPNQGI